MADSDGETPVIPTTQTTPPLVNSDNETAVTPITPIKHTTPTPTTQIAPITPITATVANPDNDTAVTPIAPPLDEQLAQKYYLFGAVDDNELELELDDDAKSTTTHGTNISYDLDFEFERIAPFIIKRILNPNANEFVPETKSKKKNKKKKKKKKQVDPYPLSYYLDQFMVQCGASLYAYLPGYSLNYLISSNLLNWGRTLSIAPDNTYRWRLFEKDVVDRIRRLSRHHGKIYAYHGRQDQSRGRSRGGYGRGGGGGGYGRGGGYGNPANAYRKPHGVPLFLFVIYDLTHSSNTSTLKKLHRINVKNMIETLYDIKTFDIRTNLYLRIVIYLYLNAPHNIFDFNHRDKDYTLNRDQKPLLPLPSPTEAQLKRQRLMDERRIQAERDNPYRNANNIAMDPLPDAKPPTDKMKLTQREEVQMKMWTDNYFRIEDLDVLLKEMEVLIPSKFYIEEQAKIQTFVDKNEDYFGNHGVLKHYKYHNPYSVGAKYRHTISKARRRKRARQRSRLAQKDKKSDELMRDSEEKMDVLHETKGGDDDDGDGVGGSGGDSDDDDGKDDYKERSGGNKGMSRNMKRKMRKKKQKQAMRDKTPDIGKIEDIAWEETTATKKAEYKLAQEYYHTDTTRIAGEYDRKIAYLKSLTNGISQIELNLVNHKGIDNLADIGDTLAFWVKTPKACKNIHFKFIIIPKWVKIFKYVPEWKKFNKQLREYFCPNLLRIRLLFLIITENKSIVSDYPGNRRNRRGDRSSKPKAALFGWTYCDRILVFQAEVKDPTTP